MVKNIYTSLKTFNDPAFYIESKLLIVFIFNFKLFARSKSIIVIAEFNLKQRGHNS